ncbi:MAG: 4-hydroxy-tetrahydrodipicolinate reductase [Firmicutes bacterium]|jgi:4-hydroxy-tetrahydrodipicolinate reductase|nr:4-hydroxy-tetrahydrodipicolinate reductase [Bacillota bacterium]
MGRHVLREVINAADLELVGAVDPAHLGEDLGILAGLSPLGISVQKDLATTLRASKADVMVDFTTPMTAFDNVVTAIECGVRPVVGTTGMGQEELDRIGELCSARGLGCLIAPNFALGAVVMMHLCKIAAPYFPQVEIIELHHDQKVDAPSGTAIKTAEMILGNRSGGGTSSQDQDFVEKVKGVRGGNFGGVQIHSVRLPGLVAHQEVIFGLEGQTVTIRHDSFSRDSFMPGVLLGIRRVGEIKGVMYGLEGLLFAD